MFECFVIKKVKFTELVDILALASFPLYISVSWNNQVRQSF